MINTIARAANRWTVIAPPTRLYFFALAKGKHDKRSQRNRTAYFKPLH
jgi:hypothetical protein